MLKLIKALTTKCTCITKTPDTEYHKVGCAYKVAWNSHFKGENKLNKQEWIEEANKYLVSITGVWYNNHSMEYCEALYENYIEDEVFGDDWTPQDAVDEDMTYWE